MLAEVGAAELGTSLTKVLAYHAVELSLTGGGDERIAFCSGALPHPGRRHAEATGARWGGLGKPLACGALSTAAIADMRLTTDISAFVAPTQGEKQKGKDVDLNDPLAAASMQDHCRDWSHGAQLSIVVRKAWATIGAKSSCHSARSRRRSRGLRREHCMLTRYRLEACGARDEDRR